MKTNSQQACIVGVGETPYTRWGQIIVHHPAHSAMKTVVPYNIVVVDFPTYDHVRLVSNLIDVPSQDIRIDLDVEVTWETAGNDVLVPRFKRRGS